MKQLHQCAAVEIVQAIASGRATCETVARACLERIAEREPRVQAWQYLDADLMLEQARALDRHGSGGPLLGVPVGMKHIVDTCAMPTEYGTPIHRGHRRHIGAACVALTRRAGGVPDLDYSARARNHSAAVYRSERFTRRRAVHRQARRRPPAFRGRALGVASRPLIVGVRGRDNSYHVAFENFPLRPHV
ncbi:MAG: amidase family protein [Burkholderiales bacterium]